MVNMEFYKMSGHGNDFILVDNWDGQVAAADMPEMARLVCRRQYGGGRGWYGLCRGRAGRC